MFWAGKKTRKNVVSDFQSKSVQFQLKIAVESKWYWNPTFVSQLKLEQIQIWFNFNCVAMTNLVGNRIQIQFEFISNSNPIKPSGSLLGISSNVKGISWSIPRQLPMTTFLKHAVTFKSAICSFVWPLPNLNVLFDYMFEEGFINQMSK